MQILNRPQAPEILSTFNYKIDKWNNVSTKKKELIWIQLTKMQGNRCAYCQGKIRKHERHIEHFIQRAKDLSQTFEWANLFGSCTRDDGCGFYKDKQKYTDGIILKPDIDDPTEFFHFLSSGRLSINSSLNLYDKERANETIRVFNLDPVTSSMRYLREKAIKMHSHLAIDMLKVMTEFINDPAIDDCKNILKEILDEKLNEITGIPYELAVKSYFRNQCMHLL